MRLTAACAENSSKISRPELVRATTMHGLDRHVRTVERYGAPTS